jgi:hypothetical protein
MYNKVPDPQGGFGGGQGNPTNKRGSGFSNDGDGIGIVDAIAKKLGKSPSKDVFDNYMNKLDKGKLTSKPYNINNILQNDATGKKEISKLQNIVNDVFNDPNYETDIDREFEINNRYMDARKTFPNLKNILGQLDYGKKDGIKITRDNNGAVTSIKAKKAFDFTGLTDMGGADVVTGLPAMGYASYKGLPKYFKGKDGKRVESPTMNLEIKFKIPKTKNKYDRFGRLDSLSLDQPIIRNTKLAGNFKRAEEDANFKTYLKVHGIRSSRGLSDTFLRMMRDNMRHHIKDGTFNPQDKKIKKS